MDRERVQQLLRESFDVIVDLQVLLNTDDLSKLAADCIHLSYNFTQIHKIVDGEVVARLDREEKVEL